MLIGLFLIFIVLLLGWPYLSGVLSPVQIKEQKTLVRLYIHSTGEIIKIPLNDYVAGVVAAEMPAEFPPEALKAQAVAARTYILKRLKAGGLVNEHHPGADICDDHRDGQAWISRQEMKKRWGTLDYYRYYYKVRQAVDDTQGRVIVYQGQLIDPVYHSSCGGRGAESAGDVWHFDEPYLQGVSCPYCSDPEPVRVAGLSVSQVNRLLKINLDAVPVSGTAGGKTRNPSSELKVVEYTAAGRPKAVRLGDKNFPATVARDLLGLRSTDFSMKLKNDEVIVRTSGYGHGVGMCQYGAKGFAEHDYTYGQILKHYYTGVEIARLPER